MNPKTDLPRLIRRPLECRSVGNTLLINPRGLRDGQVHSLAQTLAPDPQHNLVVVDLPTRSPQDRVWELVARTLDRKPGSFRLVLGPGSRAESQAVAQRLADRLKRIVLAPDGAPVPAAGGALFVPPPRGYGWMRYQPGQPAVPDSRRFPKPRWEAAVSGVPRPIGVCGIAEPLPGGMWLRRAREDAATRLHRLRLIDRLVGQENLLCIVLGVPGGAPLPLTEIAAFWRSLPADGRSLVLFVPYGPVEVPQGATLGQALADLLDYQVVICSGIPATVAGNGQLPEVSRLLGDGSTGWWPYARAFGYVPSARTGGHAARPTVLGDRLTDEGLPAIEPGVYRYGPEVVLEVVPSGLWVRPPQVPTEASAIRGAAADPRFAAILFDETSPGPRQSRMRAVAEEAARRLAPTFGAAPRVLPSGFVGRLGDAVEQPKRPVSAPSPAKVAAAVPSPSAETIKLEAAAPEPAESRPTERMPTEGRPDTVPDGVPDAVSDGVPDGVPDVATDKADGERESSSGGPSQPVPPTVMAPPADEAVRPSHAAMGDNGVAGGIRSDTVPPAGKVSPAPGQGANAAEPRDDTAPREAPKSVAALIRLESTPLPGSPARAATASPEKAVSTPVAPAEDTPARPAQIAAGQGIQVQSVPESAACVGSPDEGVDQEREWMRRSLGERYDDAAGLAARVISESPGLGGLDKAGTKDAIADLAALRLYLLDASPELGNAIRGATVGPHVPLGRCATSGLRRLPSYRGVVMLRARLGESARRYYPEGGLITEWGFCAALTDAHPGLPGDTDILIWAMTARRTALLAPEVPDRVLFLPGTNFKVLQARDGEPNVVLLRELATSEIGESGKVEPEESPLDGVALTGLKRAEEILADTGKARPLPDEHVDRFGAAPGLIIRG
ncbi:MAG TPA: hypothetical protein VFG87_25320 [Amycolatopsis sp.]|nr:hypothetical protein [Amycolatopsis sp.]